MSTDLSTVKTRAELKAERDAELAAKAALETPEYLATQAAQRKVANLERVTNRAQWFTTQTNISTSGRDSVNIPLNGLTQEDIASIKTALTAKGYCSCSCPGASMTDVLHLCICDD